MDLNEYLLALPGIVGLLATITKILVDYRKTKAEAGGVIIDSAVDVVSMLRAELTCAKEETLELRKRIRKLEARISILEKQIVELGEEPVKNGDH